MSCKGFRRRPTTLQALGSHGRLQARVTRSDASLGGVTLEDVAAGMAPVSREGDEVRELLGNNSQISETGWDSQHGSVDFRDRTR